jgi:hypothetical protein
MLAQVISRSPVKVAFRLADLRAFWEAESGKPGGTPDFGGEAVTSPAPLTWNLCKF